MTAPIERPDWGEGAALVPAEDGNAVQPAEPADAFASAEVERRYRAMVASRMAKASLPADEARGALDPALVVEWEASGGFTARLTQAQRGAIPILERLDPGRPSRVYRPVRCVARRRAFGALLGDLAGLSRQRP